jgi:4-amino-4-deoxy-L-arabinose transferase-like glycosyltransferase
MRTRDEPSAAPGPTVATRTLLGSHRDAIVLAVLWIAVTGMNLRWLSLNARPPHWDEANHLANSITYLALLSPGHLGEWLQTYTYYPPFVYWVADVFYVAARRTDVWVAVLSQSVFLAILIGSTYGIGRHLWSSRVGLMAALFVATAPMLVSGFKDFMLDAPLAAMAALGLYLLIRSREFRVPWASLLFGVVCGLGMLTKWTFVFALIVPAFAAGAFALVDTVRRRSPARILPVTGAVGLLLIVAAPWYLGNLSSLLRDAILLTGCPGCGWYAQVEGDPPLTTVHAWLWYGWDLVSLQLFLVPFGLFLVGIVIAVRDRAAARRNIYPLLFVSGIYFVQTLLVSKDPRYSLPLIAGVAVLGTYWIDRVRPPPRTAVAAAISVYCTITFLALSFGSPLLPQKIDVALPKTELVSELPDFTPAGDFVAFRGLRIWSQQGYPLGRPSADQWHQEELFQIAARESSLRTLWYHGANVDTIWFNDLAMRYFSLRYGVRLVADPAGADVAAIRTLPVETPGVPLGFSEMRAFSLPDGSTLRVYRRS